ncbi:hypothetical protein Syun_016882 [Stephania yunnanensis]|uniref:Uncharacterized protein n=1 Tax=Stephania yunnanensis TaxID=152371 RepID=A0AAP0J7H0_9MAGN
MFKWTPGTRSRVSVLKSRRERNILRFAIYRAPRTSSRGNAPWLGETFVYSSPLMIFTGFHY